jgi:hypothetical protein
MTNQGVESAAAGPQRPVLITIICVISIIGAALAVPEIYTEFRRGYAPVLAISWAAGLACTAGLWMMRKWALYAYTAVTAFNQLILISMGVWSPFALIIPGIVVVVMFIYGSKMR